MSKIIINEQGEEFVVLNGVQVKLKRVKQMPSYNPNKLIADAQRHFFEKINIEIEKMKNQ